MKSFFKIIIPVFNCEEYIEKCIMSVENQTFKNFVIIAVNDLSTDNTFNIVKNLAEKYQNIICVEADHKVWNGGARNIGIHYNIESKYTLFLDNDDWFDNEDCLQVLYNTIQRNNQPDCVRLSYKFLMGENPETVILDQSTPQDLVNSVYIAPWTKCVKSELVVDFPENTLVEDVVQHIAQCDNIETMAVCPLPINVWNRNNTKSISLKENQHFYNSKRISSVYRNIADLMDLQCRHDYCEQHRLWRISRYKEKVSKGEEDTF